MVQDGPKCQRPCCQADGLARELIDEVAQRESDINPILIGRVVASFAYSKLQLEVVESYAPRRFERSMPGR